MNRVELVHFHDRLNAREMDDLRGKLKKLGIKEVPIGDEGQNEQLAADIREAALDEFLERLEPYGLAADFYVPVSFAGVLTMGGARCASAQRLFDALGTLRAALQLDEDAGARSPRLARQRNLWRVFRRGAKSAAKKKLVLDVVRL